ARFEPGPFRDKELMHRRLQRGGIPSAFVGAASTQARCRDLVWSAGLPAVIKPADYGASNGVRLVEDERDITDAYATAAQRAPSGGVVVDRFVPGAEGSVECVSTPDGAHHVLAITEKMVSHPPFFVELGHLVPARVPKPTRKVIEDLVRRTLTALGMQRGVSHTEVKLGPDGPVIIESAGRQAGDMIPKLVTLATGANPYLLELAAILGEDAAMLPVVPGSAVAPGRAGRARPGTADRAACTRFFGSNAGDFVEYPPIQECLAGLDGLIVELNY